MLYCKESFVDAGTVTEGIQVPIEFEFENQGSESYTLKPWVACGCSTGKLNKADIVPGEKMTFTIVFDSLGKVGLNNKSGGIWYGDKNRMDVKFKVEVVKEKS